MNVTDTISQGVEVRLLNLALVLVLDEKYCLGFLPTVAVGGQERPDLYHASFLVSHMRRSYGRCALAVLQHVSVLV